MEHEEGVVEMTPNEPSRPDLLETNHEDSGKQVIRGLSALLQGPVGERNSALELVSGVRGVRHRLPDDARTRVAPSLEPRPEAAHPLLAIIPGLIDDRHGVARTIPGLTDHAGRMAPIKQKRRARNGAVTVPVEVQMPPVLKDDVDGAAKASGVSRSLYFELLLQQLRDSTGHLPVLAPTFDIDQEAHISAA